MKKDIILAGVGGQGILSIAAIIGYAAMESGMRIKQAEVHGMSQRGGDVQSHLRLSHDEIWSDLVPMGGADMIIGVEPMESLRYVPYLAENGWMISNMTPVVNITNYPDLGQLHTEIGNIPNHVLFDADSIAKELGNPKASNMVILGAASVHIEIPAEKFEEGIRFIFGRKGEDVVKQNIDAFNAGRKAATK